MESTSLPYDPRVMRVKCSQPGFPSIWKWNGAEEMDQQEDVCCESPRTRIQIPRTRVESWVLENQLRIPVFCGHSVLLLMLLVEHSFRRVKLYLMDGQLVTWLALVGSVWRDGTYLHLQLSSVLENYHFWVSSIFFPFLWLQKDISQTRISPSSWPCIYNVGA